jgi:diguanylate cyclase (GGDEF)-like protein/PAS domain S-box-containing protein
MSETTTATLWIYLPLVLFVTLQWGRFPGLLFELGCTLVVLTLLVPPIGVPLAADAQAYARLMLAVAGTVAAIIIVDILNHRRLEAERHGRAEAETLADIGRRISASLNLNEVLQQAAESARTLAGADIVAISLTRVGPNRPAVALVGQRSAALQGLAPPLDTGLVYQLTKQARPIQVHWGEDHGKPVSHPTVIEAITAEGILSTLAVPIQSEGLTVGVFWIHSRTHREFTPDEVALLERLAAQVGVAIANAHAHAEEQRAHVKEQEARAEVEALLAATASLGTQADPESVLRTLIEQAASLLDAERATYAVWRNERVVIPYVWLDGEWILEEQEVPPGGIAKHVWDTGQPYGTNTIDSDPYANIEVARGYHLRSQLTAPLLGPDGERLGLISVNNSRRPDGFTARDERLLVAICETGADVLRRARDTAARLEAEHAAARREQEVEALLAAADQINSTSEAAEILRRVVGIAAELLGVRRAGIATNEGDVAVRRHSLIDNVWTSEDTRLDLDGSIAGWVIQHARPFRTTSLSASQQQYSPTFPASVPDTALAVPILAADGAVLGTLLLFDRRDGLPFSEDDERLAVGIAHHAAVALERARLMEERRQDEARLSHLVAWSSDIIAVLNAEGNVTYVSPAVEQVLGYSPDELLGKSGLFVFHADDRPRAAERLNQVRTGENGFSLSNDYRVRHRDGTWRYVAVHTTNLLTEPGIRGLVVNVRDMTDRVRLEAELREQAFSDALTGLPNRARFLDQLGEALDAGQYTPVSMAVLFIDLDGFKLINDSLGHAVGDEALVLLARRLLAVVDQRHAVARLGGDEFAVLLTGIAEPRDALLAADRIIKDLEHGFTIESRSLFLSASVGITVHRKDDGPCQAEDLMREADIALYHAKAAGKGQAVVFTPAMGQEAVRRLDLLTDLQGAPSRGELRLFYQPIVHLRSRSIVGAEALMRWQQPGLPLREPASFIPLAEETGLILLIGRWALEEACRQAKAWQAVPGAPAFVSVNLSARQFEQQDLADQVHAALRAAGVGPEALHLEITETAIIKDPKAAIATLTALRKLGVHVAIDDFGTGYSSLSYLQRLPVDRLKIDQTFIQGMQSSNADSAVVQAVIALAHALNIEVTAEGIEMEEQRSVLADLGCDYGQGYYLSRPLPPDALAEMWTRGRAVG